MGPSASSTRCESLFHALEVPLGLLLRALEPQPCHEDGGELAGIESRLAPQSQQEVRPEPTLALDRLRELDDGAVAHQRLDHVARIVRRRGQREVGRDVIGQPVAGGDGCALDVVLGVRHGAGHPGVDELAEEAVWIGHGLTGLSRAGRPVS